MKKISKAALLNLSVDASYWCTKLLCNSPLDDTETAPKLIRLSPVAHRFHQAQTCFIRPSVDGVDAPKAAPEASTDEFNNAA